MSTVVKDTAWFVQMKPWKEAPFTIQLVVVTCKGEDEATKLFKEFYKLENGAEPDTCIEIPILKGTVVTDAIN